MALSGIVAGTIVLASCGEKFSQAPTPEARSTPQGICPSYAGTVVSEERLKATGWRATLIECVYGPEDSDALVADLYVVLGEVPAQRIAKELTGRQLPLPDGETVFACEDNIAMSSTGPQLIHISGRVAALSGHVGTVSACRRVGNGRQVLVSYADSKDMHPFTIVRVFNLDGAMLVEKRLEHAGTVEFSVDGVTYTEQVAKPDFPG